MKNKIARLLLATGILFFVIGFIMNYYNFSSTSYTFGRRIHSINITKEYIDGFSMKTLGFLIFILGVLVYYDNSKKNTSNSNDSFKKARDIEKLMKAIKKNEK